MSSYPKSPTLRRRGRYAFIKRGMKNVIELCIFYNWEIKLLSCSYAHSYVLLTLLVLQVKQELSAFIHFKEIAFHFLVHSVLNPSHIGSFDIITTDIYAYLSCIQLSSKQGAFTAIYFAIYKSVMRPLVRCLWLLSAQLTHSISIAIANCSVI